MAITVGTVSTGTSTGTNSLSYSHTVAAGTTLLLVLHEAGVEGPDVTDIDWNGAQMTLATQTTNNSGGNIWYLISPTPATGNVVVTQTSSNRGTVSTAVNLSGTATSSPIGDTGIGQSGSAASISCTVDTTAANSFVFYSCSKRPDTSAITPGAGQTEIVNQGQAGTVVTIVAASGYMVAATIGAYTPDYTGEAGEEWGICGAEVKAGANGGRLLMLQGVGK